VLQVVGFRLVEEGHTTSPSAVRLHERLPASPALCPGEKAGELEEGAGGAAVAAWVAWGMLLGDEEGVEAAAAVLR